MKVKSKTNSNLKSFEHLQNKCTDLKRLHRKNSVDNILVDINDSIENAIYNGYGSIKFDVCAKEKTIIAEVLLNLSDKGYQYKLKWAWFRWHNLILVSWDGFSGKSLNCRNCYRNMFDAY